MSLRPTEAECNTTVTYVPPCFTAEAGTKHGLLHGRGTSRPDPPARAGRLGTCAGVCMLTRAHRSIGAGGRCESAWAALGSLRAWRRPVVE